METPLSVRVRGKIKGQIKDNTSQDLIISSCKRVLKVLPKSVLYLSQNCSKCSVVGRQGWRTYTGIPRIGPYHRGEIVSLIYMVP